VCRNGDYRRRRAPRRPRRSSRRRPRDAISGHCAGCDQWVLALQRLSRFNLHGGCRQPLSWAHAGGADLDRRRTAPRPIADPVNCRRSGAGAVDSDFRRNAGDDLPPGCRASGFARRPRSFVAPARGHGTLRTARRCGSVGACGDCRRDRIRGPPHLRCRRGTAERGVRDRDGRVCGVSRTGARLRRAVARPGTGRHAHPRRADVQAPAGRSAARRQPCRDRLLCRVAPAFRGSGMESVFEQVCAIAADCARDPDDCALRVRRLPWCVALFRADGRCRIREGHRHRNADADRRDCLSLSL
jgi:hypothetical protein